MLLTRLFETFKIFTNRQLTAESIKCLFSLLRIVFKPLSASIIEKIAKIVVTVVWRSKK